MSENWAVFLRDWLGNKHIVNIAADSQPSAAEAAKRMFDRPVTVKRCRRVFNNDEVSWS